MSYVFLFFQFEIWARQALDRFCARFGQLEVGSGIRHVRKKETLAIAWVAVFAFCINYQVLITPLLYGFI